MMPATSKDAAPEGVSLNPLDLLESIHEAGGERDLHMATKAGRKAELKKLQQDESSWAVYRTLCQFRLGYFSFLVMMVIIIFSFAFLMEIFFAIFLPSARADPNFTSRSIVLLTILPFAVVLLSYVFEESSRFFADAVDKSEGSLNDFRLAVAVVIHYLRHHKEMPEDRLFDQITARLEGQQEKLSFLRQLSGFWFKNDPFDDKDKEEEDAKRSEIEDEFYRNQANAFGSDEPSSQSSGTAASRWKKAKAAIKSSAAFKKTSFEGPPLDFSTLVIVDLLFPVLFEVVTLWAFISTVLYDLSPLNAFMDYIQAGFFISAFYLVIWIVTHFWSSRNRKMREYVSNYRRRRRSLKRALADLESEKKSNNLWLVDVGFRAYEYFHSVFFSIANKLICCGAASTAEERKSLLARQAKEANEIEAAVEGEEKVQTLHEQIVDELHDWNPWHKLSYPARFIILIPLTLGSAVLSFSRFYLGWTIMGACLIILAHTIQGRFPQIFGSAFRHFITAFVVLSLVFFSSTFVVGTFVMGGDFKILPPETNVTTFAPPVESVSMSATSSVFGSIAKYPVCTLDFSGLDIIDFALIADAVYGHNTSVQEQAFGERFNGTELGDWKYVTRNDEKTDHQTWVELNFPSINMTVVAVRGTASAADALEDLHYWFGVSILQAVNVFIPFLRQLPSQFVVDMLSLNVLSGAMPHPVYSDLLDHVTKLKERVGNRLVITGHSLGGAMAGMVGAKTKTPAVSFSGPGLIYSRGRFNIADADIRDYVLTIKPRRDMVPRVDELGGMVQEIECRRMNPLACHSTITHVCELHASCGDKRHRDWTEAEQCLDYFGLKK